MKKDIKKNISDKEYQEMLERSRLILQNIKSGIWDQIHGTVPSKNINHEPTEQDWKELREEIKRMIS